MDTKNDSSTALHVVLLWLPDALHGSLLCTLDALRTAAMCMNMQHPKQPYPFSWEIISSSGAAIDLPGLAQDNLCSQRHDRSNASRTLFVVPGLHTQNSPKIGQLLENYGIALELLRAHAAAGGWIAATYTGIALPARLGLLDGARIGASWAHQSWFTRSFPKCDFSDSAPFARHERIFTCVAPALQTDFILNILGNLGHADLAEMCGHVLLYQGRRQEIIPEIVKKKWATKTSDSPVHRAMEWLGAHIDEPYSLAILANAAATSERTLLRHFHQVAGMTPLDYLHDLRVERAKTLLQVTLQTVHTVAQACGYSDAASFRRIFSSATGMTPTEYRSRFSLRTRRRHWRVEAFT